MLEQGEHASTLSSVYTWGCYDRQNPLTIDYIARLGGIPRPGLTQPFTYCDLGCGNGVSINTFASNMPQGQFYGIDINPKHIANAKELSTQGKLTNTHFVESSFYDLLKEDLPQFDYIAIHGVYGWVNQAVKQDILNIIKKFIKPNGLVYISYNAMPGSSHVHPIQKLIKTCDTFVTGKNEIERTQNSVNLLKVLMNDSSAYFTIPNVKERASSIIQHDLSYVAHEYLVDDWVPLYFPEVAQALNTIEMSFAGEVFTAQKNWMNNISEELTQMMKSLPSDELRELFQDYQINRSFRCDIYANNTIERITDKTAKAHLLNDLYVLNTPIVNWDAGKLDYATQETFLPKFTDDLVEITKIGNNTIGEIAALPIFNQYDYLDVIYAITQMISARTLRNTLAPAAGINTNAKDQAVILSHFNQHAIKWGLENKILLPLASPVLGTAMSYPVMDLALLYSLSSCQADNLLENAEKLFDSLGIELQKDGKNVTKGYERSKVLNECLIAYQQHALPHLHNIGIVQ